MIMVDLKKKIQIRNGHIIFLRGVVSKVKELLPETDRDVKFKLEALCILFYFILFLFYFFIL